MSPLKARHAIAIAAAVAVLVYGNALGNGWAQDDRGIVETNPAAQSIGAALGAWFAPYWPAEEQGSAGLYRPLVTLSYGVDWAISGGRPWWFHLTNVGWHALATALAVAVLLLWLRPLPALTAGLVFAVHSVHVEAVSNVVGRAELMAAVGILAAVLAARQYRRASSDRARRAWLAATVGAVLFGLFSKEHAVVSVAILAFDHWLDPAPRRAPSSPLYGSVAAVTVGWFHIWRAVAGGSVEVTVAAALRGLSAAERLATAVPVQLDVIRLLAWPFQLSAGYDPQVIPQRLEWSAVAALAALAALAVVALAIAARRRAPAFTFAVLAGMATFAPTSNILFASGVTLAERALYFAALVPAAAAAWAVSAAWGSRYQRAVAIGVGALLLAYAGRTVTRTPFWRDTRTVVLEDYLQHPENYRAHIRVARALEELGDTRQALREYLWAWELFPNDPYLVEHLVRVGLALEHPGVAVWSARWSRSLRPNNATIASLLVDAEEARGRPDSAMAALRTLLERNPSTVRGSGKYHAVLQAADAPSWLQGVARARWLALQGRWIGAADAFRGAVREAGDAPAAEWCWELQRLDGVLFAALDGEAWEQALQLLRRSGAPCPGLM